MKACLFPKKEAVKAILEAEVAELQESLAAALEKQARLNSSLLFVQEHEKVSANQSIQFHENALRGLSDKLALLEAHDPPEVRVELEIG